MTSRISRIGGLSIALLSTLTLAACGSKLSGEYSDPDGMVSYHFESGGRVYVSAMGNETELKYAVNDRKVRIEMPEGNQILTLLDDGSLQGPMGMKLVKKK
ncbi:MAG: hypothetical protein IT489_05740 [Gammaproteobacteria bacterium]|nr:hypothetical protein [Gammaproteobacteria bacterium]